MSILGTTRKKAASAEHAPWRDRPWQMTTQQAHGKRLVATPPGEFLSDDAQGSGVLSERWGGHRYSCRAVGMQVDAYLGQVGCEEEEQLRTSLEAAVWLGFYRTTTRYEAKGRCKSLLVMPALACVGTCFTSWSCRLLRAWRPVAEGSMGSPDSAGCRLHNAKYSPIKKRLNYQAAVGLIWDVQRGVPKKMKKGRHKSQTVSPASGCA